MKAYFLLLVGCGCVLGQPHHHAPPSAGAIDLKALPPPQKITGIGQSHIAITTKSPEAQVWFDQGLALLHCFWDYEALRAFEQAVRLDPDCAMCHWGVARALNFRGKSNEEQAKAELAKAKELSAKASDHESRYIRADVASDEKKGDEADRAYLNEMEALVDHYPDDLEAKLMVALSQMRGYDEKGAPVAGSLYSQAALRNLLTQYPDNAAANHYWIHAVEPSSHPEWALESAAKLGRLAPSSGHMVHMPGHIYYRTGDYERARQIFLAAKRVDEDYMAAQHVAVRNDWNYAHNISYLIADCAEEGRYAEAREHARTLAGLSDDPEHSGQTNFYVFQIGSTEARLAARFGNWDEAIAKPMQFGVPDEKLSPWVSGYRNGFVHYARGMKAAEASELDAADGESNSLDASLWRLSKEKVDEKSEGARGRVLKLLGVASLELRGNLLARRGDLDGGRKLLERAAEAEKSLGYSEPPQYARPALEVLGDVCIRAGKYQDARTAFENALKERPRSGFALFGIARSWDKEGDHAKAAEAYRAFLGSWSHADPDLPQMQAAKAYLAQASR